ncbi:hypothetical protein PSEHALCIP103_02260 [Pseudoalteromonas haloplanktis]|uniref:Uncharacterized protein n=1 Tax=Pseudoalteromonas haloplanktis TaxID=228 RepID=A0A9W4VWQ9_PSEHA|nr:hypothetical protein PSEHALCIP103_02260 [Pseudoalteromonas haloplanktis]
MSAWYEQYDHPLWTKMGEEAQRNGGHGGMVGYFAVISPVCE